MCNYKTEDNEKQIELKLLELQDAFYFCFCSNTGITKKDSLPIFDKMFGNNIMTYDHIMSIYTIIKSSNNQYYRIKEFEAVFEDIINSVDIENNISIELIDEEVLEIEL